MPNDGTRHYLTVDLEDWHELMLRRFAGGIGGSPSQVTAQIGRLLRLLAQSGTRATAREAGLEAVCEFSKGDFLDAQFGDKFDVSIAMGGL